VVIDPMSNSAYLGTDEDGLPIPAEKSEEDRRYADTTYSVTFSWPHPLLSKTA
jgi:hypothetical protein